MRLKRIFCSFALYGIFFAGPIRTRADIIYNPTNFLLGDIWTGEEFFDLDLNADNTIDFTLVASMDIFSGIHPEEGNRYLIHPSPPPNIGGPVAALESGYLIASEIGAGEREEWFGSRYYSTLIQILSSGKSGEFYNHRGFVGVEFQANDGTHYGWIDVEGILSGSLIEIRGWAYESEPGKGIVAGAIPEPSSVSLFGLGGGLAWLLRRRESAPFRRRRSGRGKG